jgi:mono/diheme cytochrome c family protein
MHQHQRAVDLMLQGLMVPSTPLWREGAEGFRSSPLQPRDLPRDPMLARDIVQAEERAHRLASQAVQAYDSAARAGFYAQILAQCAECHQSGGGEWGPKPR